MKPLMLDEIVVAMEGTARPPLPGAAPRPPCSVTGVTTDSRHVRAGDLFFAIRGQNRDGHAFVGDALRVGAVAAVVACGYERPGDLDDAAIVVEVDDPVRALGRLARFHRRQLPADVVAVTGSNGKTTTREMITHVLAGRRKGRCSIKSFNNEIGVPLTLLSAEAADEFLVAEVGTNAPGEIDALARLIEPEVAVVTGVAPVHLERLGSLEGVAQEKLSLLRHIRPGGCAIVNIDADVVRSCLAEMRRPPSALLPAGGGLSKDAKVVTIGRHEDADLRLTSVRTVEAGGAVNGSGEPTEHGIEFEVNGKFAYHLNVLGPHNATNALAAVAVARRFGLEHAEIADRLATFRLPAMRLERRRLPWRNGSHRGEIEIIMDAYNANPASVAAAIDVLRSYPCGPNGRRVIVLGDMRELGPRAGEFHEEVARQVAAGGIDMLLAVGAHAKRMAATARQSRKGDASGAKLEIHAMASTEAAARRVGPLCRPGDVVLVKGSRAMGLERVVEAMAKRAR
jgi:UDP-N-acetylmuramoyl-tripeptide--D-alanyl-D-alanine ligase